MLHDRSRVLRHDLPINNMHLSVEFAVPIRTSLRRTHMSRITFRIPTLIRVTTGKTSSQIPQCVQLLARQPSIMARFASWLWTLTLEKMVVAEFLSAKPYDHRLLGAEWRIDSLALRVAKDRGFWGVDCGPVFCVTEDVWERKALDYWQHRQQVGYTVGSLEEHETPVISG